MEPATTTDDLLALLAPMLAKVAELHPANRTDPAAATELVAALEQAFPFEGTTAQAVGQALRKGIEDGSLCTQGAPQARFSRVTKPTPATHDLSVDVVALEGPALAHTHPNGEITLGFASAGHQPDAVAFDGHRPGWVFMPPGSTHTPTVTGGRMDLVYFLPGGAVKWHR